MLTLSKYRHFLTHLQQMAFGNIVTKEWIAHKYINNYSVGSNDCCTSPISVGSNACCTSTITVLDLMLVLNQQLQCLI